MFCSYKFWKTNELLNIIIANINFTAQKWNFPLRISSVNVTKSAGNCAFVHIYWRNPNEKLYFLCSVCLNNLSLVIWIYNFFMNFTQSSKITQVCFMVWLVINKCYEIFTGCIILIFNNTFNINWYTHLLPDFVNYYLF